MKWSLISSLRFIAGKDVKNPRNGASIGPGHVLVPRMVKQLVPGKLQGLNIHFPSSRKAISGKPKRFFYDSHHVYSIWTLMMEVPGFTGEGYKKNSPNKTV